MTNSILHLFPLHSGNFGSQELFLGFWALIPFLDAAQTALEPSQENPLFSWYMGSHVYLSALEFFATYLKNSTQ